MAITNHHSSACDSGGQRCYVASPTGMNVAPRSDDPLVPGGPYALIQLALWPVRAALGILVSVCAAYLVLFVSAAAASSDQNTGDPASMLATVGELLAQMRDACGPLAALGGTPSPTTAALVGVGAVVVGNALRSASRALNQSGITWDLKRAELNVATGAPLSARERRDDRTASTPDRTRRISGAHHAVAQLDAEWLAYEQDVEAYYLTKPVLRDLGVAETAAYRSALYDLRNLAEMLSDTSTGQELDAAERAADAALLAWGVANDHALAVGVSDRSPTERAALRRLHALVGQLADPSTPKVMWSSIVDAISREMGKLSTVPTSWEHLSRVPALVHRNPAAIASPQQ